MAIRSPVPRVSLQEARSFWYARQGLEQKVADDPAEAVGRCGWLRTLGGIDVYLGARARTRELRRATLDEAVAARALRVMPAVRGCIYLVPEADAAAAMALASELSRRRTERDLERVGVEWSEVEGVAAAVREALAPGPLSPQALRKALPEGTVRGLGATGKKVGLSSPLPVALRELEFQGEVERVLSSGRLDTERYEWRLAAKPLTLDPGTSPLEVVVRRFFEFFAPATVKDLSAWTGVSQRDARAVMEELEVAPVTVEEYGEAWIPEGDLEALAAAREGEGSFSFLPFEDNLVTVHGGPRLLVDPPHREQPVTAWGSSKPTTVGEAKHLSTRTLFLDSRLVGFWEFDAEGREVVVMTFQPLPRRLHRGLTEECEALAAFIGDELGHARSFSLDTDEAVRKRVEAIRARG